MKAGRQVPLLERGKWAGKDCGVLYSQEEKQENSGRFFPDTDTLSFLTKLLLQKLGAGHYSSVCGLEEAAFPKHQQSESLCVPRGGLMVTRP